MVNYSGLFMINGTHIHFNDYAHEDVQKGSLIILEC